MMASEPSPSADPYSRAGSSHDPKLTEAARQRMSLFDSQSMPGDVVAPNGGPNGGASSSSSGMMPSHYGAGSNMAGSFRAALEYSQNTTPYSNPMSSYGTATSSSFGGAASASPYANAATAGMQDSFLNGSAAAGGRGMYGSAAAAGFLPSSMYPSSGPGGGGAAQFMYPHPMTSGFRGMSSSAYAGLSPTSAMLLSSGAGGGAGGFTQAELFDHQQQQQQQQHAQHAQRQSFMGNGAGSGMGTGGFSHPGMDSMGGASGIDSSSMYGAAAPGMMGMQGGAPNHPLDSLGAMAGFGPTGGVSGHGGMASSFSNAMSSGSRGRVSLENSQTNMLLSSAAAGGAGGPNDTSHVHSNTPGTGSGSFSQQDTGRTTSDSQTPSTGGTGAAAGSANGNDGSITPMFQKTGVTSCPMVKPVPMAMPSDNDFITPLHCFIRLHCVELFTATQDDVFTPSKGKRRPIQLHQVGIRCPHCHGCNQAQGQSTKIGHERGSVYYPNNISSIYNATMNLLQRHLHVCDFVPKEIMKIYNELKADDARSGTSKRYWIDSALALGLFDTPTGIRWCNPSMSSGATASAASNSLSQPLRGDNGPHGGVGDFPYSALQANDNPNTMNPAMMHGANFGNMDQNHGGDASSKGRGSSFNDVSLVHPEDKHLSTRYSFALLSQMRSCRFTEADRLGKRKGLPIGFSGLACMHCYGGYGSGRFFPSTIKTMSDTSKTLNVLHSHMMKCRKCPDEVRERLIRLRDGHDEERARMKFGSQKAFFVNIWQRLHGEMPPRVAMKRKRFSQSETKEEDERTKHVNRVMASYEMNGGDICQEAVPPLQQL